MYAARNVGVRLGPKPILEGIELSAPAGVFTAILGPNGSGKTTLLRALAGELPFTGTITLNGADIRTLKPAAAAVMRAVLPQAANLAFPFTVREVVAIGQTAGRSGAPAHAEPLLPERALERVGLSGFAGRFYQELSGGEQQRVQLARVLCQVWTPVIEGTPRFLLLDEPVSSLDIRHQLAIMDIGREFARAGGGVVAVLHDLNLAAMFADQIVIMRAGRIAAAGTPTAVLDDALLASVFATPLRVGAVPGDGQPFVLPQSVAALSSTPSR